MLKEYIAKRDFSKTPEPKGSKTSATARAKAAHARTFVVQRHAASHLHHDFRLEIGGVLVSWAVPKGPSMDPRDKRLAIHVEDHPLEYGSFEGVIPSGYGAGTVMLFDHGTWQTVGGKDPAKALKSGKLKFTLHGERLTGDWMLVRTRSFGDSSREQWLLVKERDDHAATSSVVDDYTTSVTTGRTMAEIAAGRPKRKVGKKKAAKNPKAKSGKAGAGVNVSAKKASAKKREPAAVDEPARQAPPEWGRAKARVDNAPLPQLATFAEEAPVGDGWVHEVKFDGYRMFARCMDGKVTLISRNGRDWTTKLETLEQAVEKRVGEHETVIDGEVVVFNERGLSDFQLLQNALGEVRSNATVFMAFDLLSLDGKDLTKLPLIERKAQLKKLIGSSQKGRLRYSEHVVGGGEQGYVSACLGGLEGIIAKRAEGLYVAGRGKDWLKVKCFNQQEFVIIGFTPPEGARTHFGSLLLGYHDDSGKLVYAGRAGTGFTAKSLANLGRKLETLTIDKPAAAGIPKEPDLKLATWTKPVLVAQVRFAEWTQDGVLRQPAFQGLREDIEASKVKRQVDTNVKSSSVASMTHKREVEGDDEAGNAKQTSPAQRDGVRVSTRLAERGKASVKRRSPAPPSSKRRAPLAALPPKVDAIEVGSVRLTSPERVVFPDRGAGYSVTKRQLAEYYASVAKWMLPQVANRPVSTLRCPDGEGGECFFQKHVGKGMPSAVKSIDVGADAEDIGYMLVKDAAGLLGLVQMNGLEIHPWGSRADNLERPDRIVFDLDPGPGVSWGEIVKVALKVRDELKAIGLTGFARTTGGKGLHVVVPIKRVHTWEQVSTFCRAVAEALVVLMPDKLVSVASKAAREKKIFIDWLRNTRGATAVASYSTRARPGANVAMPVTWKELEEGAEPSMFNVTTVPGLLKKRKDPWAEMDKNAAKLPAIGEARSCVSVEEAPFTVSDAKAVKVSRAKSPKRSRTAKPAPRGKSGGTAATKRAATASASRSTRRA